MKTLFKNLKFRLLVALFFVLFALFFTFGFSVLYTMKASYTRSLEASLTAYARDLKHDYHERALTNKPIDFDDIKKEFDDVKEEFEIPVLYTQLISYDRSSLKQTILARSEDLKEESLALSTTLIEQLIHTPDQLYFFESNNKKLSKYKIYVGTLAVHQTDNTLLILQCALPYDKRTPEMKEMKRTLIVGLCLLLVIILWIAYFLINTSFKTIWNITQSAQKITINESIPTIPKTHIAHEIDHLIDTFNTLLSELQKSYNQVKQFGQNASHELKTPLTIIQGEIEVGLRKPRSMEEYQAILRKINQEVSFLHDVIEKILFLSSNTKKELLKYFTEVYVDEVLLESIDEKKTMAYHYGIDITLEHLEPLSIQSNSVLLKMAITNLIDNAIKYACAHSSIRISLDEKKLSITNESNLSFNEQDPSLFEPFYRAKQDHQSVQGHGLGLAIVKNILDLHHLKITLTKEMPNRISATIFF